MYKSSDNELHESNAMCEMHEARLAVQPQVKGLLEQFFGLPECEAASWTVADVSNFVSANAEALFDILLPVQPKKTRAPRTVTTPAAAS